MQELKKHSIKTPIGEMTALGDNNYLYFLHFADQGSINLENFAIKNNLQISLGKSNATEQAEEELNAYFNGSLKAFKTPTSQFGTDFQKKLWLELKKIPYGKTESYFEQANKVGHNNSHRAIANACGANKIAIIVPCHRIITKNGKISGYNGGVARKEWLLNFEKNNYL